jgi:hypothetical protein
MAKSRKIVRPKKKKSQRKTRRKHRKSRSKRLKKGAGWFSLTRKNTPQPTPQQPNDMEKYRKRFLMCRSNTAKGQYLRTFYRKSCSQYVLEEETRKDLDRCILHAIVIYLAEAFEPANFSDQTQTVYTISDPNQASSYQVDRTQGIEAYPSSVFENIFKQIADEFLIKTTPEAENICPKEGASYAKSPISLFYPEDYITRQCQPTPNGVSVSAYEYVKDDTPLYIQIVRDLFHMYISQFKMMNKRNPPNSTSMPTLQVQDSLPVEGTPNSLPGEGAPASLPVEGVPESAQTSNPVEGPTIGGSGEKLSATVKVDIPFNEKVRDFIQSLYDQDYCYLEHLKVCPEFDMVCVYFKLFLFIRVGEPSIPVWVEGGYPIYNDLKNECIFARDSKKNQTREELIEKINKLPKEAARGKLVNEQIFQTYVPQTKRGRDFFTAQEKKDIDQQISIQHATTFLQGNKVKKFLLGLNKRIPYLRTICGDVGICLSLNQSYEAIMAMFNHFENFDLLESSPRVLSSGSNGIVRLLKYKMEEGKESFYSYGVFKSPVATNNYPDNLLYEYEVGTRCVNHLCRFVPIFTQTYGAYVNNYTGNDRLYLEGVLKKNDPINKALFQDPRLLRIDPTLPNYNKDFCYRFRDLCLVGQFYNKFTTIQGYITYMSKALAIGENAPNDIAFILFQLYYSLYQCRSQFTHYDLHANNVGLVPLPNGKHVEYEYVYVPIGGREPRICKFKSRYIVKVIDYGRSFFNYNGVSSEKIIKDVLISGDCSINDWDQVSMIGIPIIPKDYINPLGNNQSHDLRLLNMLNLTTFLPLFNDFPKLRAVVRKVNYANFYGTMQRLDAYKRNPNAPIYNITDACFKLTDYLVRNTDQVMDKNNAAYANSTSIGTLRVYPGLEKQMEFRFATREKTRKEEGRIYKPEFENMNL